MKSLFLRIGGQHGVSKIVLTLFERLLERPDLMPVELGPGIGRYLEEQMEFLAELIENGVRKGASAADTLAALAPEALDLLAEVMAEKGVAPADAALIMDRLDTLRSGPVSP